MKTPNSSAMDQLLTSLGEARWRPWDRRLLILLVLVLLWALFAQVDRVIVAEGKVVPFDKVKVIQHFEGGIVQHVIVRENQFVKAGEPLIELDLATGGVNGSEMNTRMGSLQFAKARLEAEARGAPLKLNPGTDPLLKASADAEVATYRARREETTDTLAAIDGQIVQNRQRVAELEARFAALDKGLRIAQQELSISENLVKDKLVSELEHIQRRGAVERIRGDSEATRQAISGAIAAVEESKARRREEESKFRRRASDELGELERKIASLNEELIRANEQETRSVIRAPIDGIVKNVKYAAVGNVVKPGEPIMEVVPVKDQLVIELKLNPADRGFIEVGQQALVKISAYDFYRFGGLTGRVEGIAADTDLGRNEEQYFRVIVQTDKAYVGSVPDAMPITPGMTAEVNVRVASNSVFWALLRPILKLKHEALREA
ncbi:MAG: HlyD family type I secretion periplasmic adaptor subunit [Porticoccaceae bacterium]|nr:HlyD family type I secretion periplasmic adaptor subunit [Porticoccaceae bacterium]